MILAIIPARLNSKRIKEKNITNFFGKPLISYAIDLAKKSKIFDKILISSESNKVLSIGKKYKADYLLKRPIKLSSDHIFPSEVIKHAIKWFELNYEKPYYICCIYPTTPLLIKGDLINSFKIIKKKNFKCVFSAAENDIPVQRTFFLNKKRNIVMFDKKSFYKRTQDLPKTYRDIGQFYWGTYDSWMNNQINFSKSSKFYLIPKSRALDIDDYDDLYKAKMLYRLLKKN